MRLSRKPVFRLLCLFAALWCLPLGLPMQAWAVEKDDPPPSLVASADPGLQPKPEELYTPYLIGPGDLLSITVYGEKDLPTNFLVDSNGTIVFPLVGEVKVSGYTQGQMSALLAKKLASYLRSPQVTVLIQETNYYTVSVLGQVVKPGKFRIRGIPKLLSVFSEAGGPLEQADLANSILIRGDRKSRLDIYRFLKDTSDHTPQPLLYPGDTIVVPKSPWPSLDEWAIIAGILASVTLIYTSYSVKH